MKVIGRKYNLRTGTKIRTVCPRFEFWHYSSITAIGKEPQRRRTVLFSSNERKKSKRITDTWTTIPSSNSGSLYRLHGGRRVDKERYPKFPPQKQGGGTRRGGNLWGIPNGGLLENMGLMEQIGKRRSRRLHRDKGRIKLLKA